MEKNEWDKGTEEKERKDKEKAFAKGRGKEKERKTEKNMCRKGITQRRYIA